MATVLFPQQWSLWLIVTAWWPFPAVASYVSPPAVSWAQQLYLVGRVGAAARKNSTCRCQAALVRAMKSGFHSVELNKTVWEVPERWLSPEMWMMSILTFDSQTITDRHPTSVFSIKGISIQHNYWLKTKQSGDVTVIKSMNEMYPDWQAFYSTHGIKNESPKHMSLWT